MHIGQLLQKYDYINKMLNFFVKNPQKKNPDIIVSQLVYSQQTNGLIKKIVIHKSINLATYT